MKQYRANDALERERGQLSKDLAHILGGRHRAETERAFGTESTRATYKREFKRFRAFCLEQDLSSLPTTPEAIAFYMLARCADGATPKALERALAAITFVHRLSDISWSFDDVIIRAAMRLCRRKSTEQPEGKPS